MNIPEELRELALFAEAHHSDQPLHVVLHGLTVDVPSRLERIIEEVERLLKIAETNRKRAMATQDTVNTLRQRMACAVAALKER